MSAPCPAAAVTVRRPRAADALRLAEVHVAAWHGAYRGLVADEALDGFTVERVRPGWQRWVAALDAHPDLLVGELDGTVMGFVETGADREGREGGELFVLNTHPDAWGHGVGPALLAAAHERLAGCGRAVLWVLPANARARRFYERAGWADDGARREAEIAGVRFPEMRYARAFP